jgi:NDP-sugar pyrophosphorylase family protein
MAGGKGTRLRPITDRIPKPMIKVAGRPILERIVLHLVGFGIRRVFVAVNYLGHIIKDYFGDGSQFGCRIDYLEEKEFLGTGGPLHLLPSTPKDPLLVMNGDLVTQANFDHMLAFHQNGGFIATIGVIRYTHQVPFGCLETDGNRIVKLAEKPVLDRLANAGIYVLSPVLLTRVPPGFFPITTLFEDCLGRNDPLGAFEIKEDWIDVGERNQLRASQFGD